MDEPTHTFRASDPEFAWVLRKWAKRRRAQIEAGEFPASTLAEVITIEGKAAEGAEWRRRNIRNIRP
jgi:hypothetical protein